METNGPVDLRDYHMFKTFPSCVSAEPANRPLRATISDMRLEGKVGQDAVSPRGRPSKFFSTSDVYTRSTPGCQKLLSSSVAGRECLFSG